MLSIKWFIVWISFGSTRVLAAYLYIWEYLIYKIFNILYSGSLYLYRYNM